MAQSFEDDNFSDGDLDLLASHTINELESKVLHSSTQEKQADGRATREQSLQIRGRVEDGRSVAADSFLKDAAVDASSDYGLDDEDIIDLDLGKFAFSDKAPGPNVGLSAGPVQDRNVPLNTAAAATTRQPQPPALVPQESRRVSLATRPAHHASVRTATYNIDPGQSSQRALVNNKDAGEAQPTDGKHGDGQDDLKSRIARLEDELANAQRSVQEAKSTAIAKAGETAIVRSKHEKSVKEYEQRLASVQATHAQELARQKSELEASKKNREKVETTNLFLQHELDQEAQKTKNLTKKSSRLRQQDDGDDRMKDAGRDSPAVTPRKARTVPFGDGFDDEGEEMIISPSKTKGKAKQPSSSTPKHGGKRKRNVAETASPVQALPLREPAGAATPTGAGESFRDGTDGAAANAKIFQADDEKFEFIQLLHGHAPRRGHVETLEAFASHSFPSNPKKSLSSIFNEELLLLIGVKDVAELSLGVCNIMFKLWELCRQESHFEPLYLLVKALHYIVRARPMSLSVDIVDTLLPLAFSTIDLLAIPVARRKVAPQQYQEVEPLDADYYRLREQIDVCDILALVHRVSLCCNQYRGSSSTSGTTTTTTTNDSDNTTATTTTTNNDPTIAAKIKFWKKMEYDFVLLMLNRLQPLDQIDQMLHILCTSALPDSIGTVLAQPDPARQARKEAVLLDLLSGLLLEQPVPVPGAPEQLPPGALPRPRAVAHGQQQQEEEEAREREARTRQYSAAEIAYLRYSAVTVLACFVGTEYGGRALATHRTTLGRLVSFVHDAHRSLYDLYRPNVYVGRCDASNGFGAGGADGPEKPSFTAPARPPTIAAVNKAVRILYHVFTQHAEHVDVRAKLAAVPGAAQKHLVALGRIAFCEGGGGSNYNSNSSGGGGYDNTGGGKEAKRKRAGEDQDMEGNDGNNGNRDGDGAADGDDSDYDDTGTVFEEGIEEEVIEAARMLLEEFLTPEEGDALSRAFVPNGGGGDEEEEDDNDINDGNDNDGKNKGRGEREKEKRQADGMDVDLDVPAAVTVNESGSETESEG